MRLAALALLTACAQPPATPAPADPVAGYRLVGVVDGCRVWRDESGAVVLTDDRTATCRADADEPGRAGAHEVWRREVAP